MSSDTFRISVTAGDDCDVTLSCVTTTAGGPNDMATSRSFVLLCLQEALDPSAPLAVALAELGFHERIVDEAFYREHAGKFISGVWLVRRENVVYDTAARYKVIAELNALEESGSAPPGFDALEELEKRFPPHRFVLRARLAERRWLEGLGEVATGTTACEVWTPDPAVNVAVEKQCGEWASGALRGVVFAGVQLSDLAASADGRRIFVRARHAIERDPPEATNQWTGTLGAGTQLALDAASFAVEERLPLADLLVRDRCHPEQVRFTRHSPRGDAVWVIAGGRANQYMFGGERSGELVDVAHCTSAGFFSDAAFNAANGDSALVAHDREVETRHCHTEWPGVRATNVVLDDERIAAAGKRDLVVYDRRARAEKFRVKVGEALAVALLSEGRTAVIAGAYGRRQLRVFDSTGQQTLALKLTAYTMKVSPSGLLVLAGSGPLRIVDLAGPRCVQVSEEPIADAAWLDDERLAVLRLDGRALGVLAVPEAMASGRVLKLEAPKSKKAVTVKSEAK